MNTAKRHPFPPLTNRSSRYINVSGSVYTISEAEKITNVCRDQIRVMIRHGKVDTVTIPGGWERIPETEICKIKTQHNKFACR